MRSSASVGALGGRHGAAFWSEERASGSVGVRLLERMGWQEGRGLGKREAGTQSFVRAKVKNDTVGIGATKGAAGDDRQHVFAQATTDIFNALLSKLNAAHTASPSTPLTGSEQAESESDVEDTSTARDAAVSIDRYVRKRHLYGRFSRAKDTSLYSQKSKLEIFGRKQTQNDKQPTNVDAPTTTSATESNINSTHSSLATGPSAPPPLPVPVPLVTSRVSLSSYFAEKLAARARSTATAADGSTAWQTALFDDISRASQIGRAGLGARTTTSRTATTAHTTTTDTSNTTTTNPTDPTSRRSQHSTQQPPHDTAVGSSSGSSDEERRERKRRRRERKEAQRRQTEQQAEEEEEEQANEQQQAAVASSAVQSPAAAAADSAEERRRRKKQKRERKLASASSVCG